jgi:hypothetical protein
MRGATIPERRWSAAARSVAGTEVTMDRSTARQELERTCGFEFVGSRVLVRDVELLAAVHDVRCEQMAYPPPPGGTGSASDERGLAAAPH